MAGADGRAFSEVFLLDLPADLTRPGAAPLAGTPATRPAPPAGVARCRPTVTAGGRFPGVGGPRFWPVGPPDGSAVGLYRHADDGRVRFCTAPIAAGGAGDGVREVTDGTAEPTSAFTWSPDGTRVAFAADRSVSTCEVPSGRLTRLTARADPGPTHHACVWSPDGKRIVYVKPIAGPSGRFDQLFVAYA